MYLSRRQIRNKTHYSIRHSYADGVGYKSRELFDLGTDPQKFIVYPGGRGYYFDSIIEDTLTDRSISVEQTELEDIFFEFLRPDIQRVISGFDRGRSQKASTKPATESKSLPSVHLFDRRRYHFLRFGNRNRQHIHRVPPKVFNPLQKKSRDELEHYFLDEESKLPLEEKALYTSMVFEMHHWSPDTGSDRSWRDQMDLFFMQRLCKLNADREFMYGVTEFSGLSAYLVRFAIYFFDYSPPRRSAENDYIRDFINRHRMHRPPASVKIKMDEAQKLFATDWKRLRQMSRAQLTKRYRRQAMKHHPDQGGDSDIFRRLTQYYQALLQRKPRDKR